MIWWVFYIEISFSTQLESAQPRANCSVARRSHKKGEHDFTFQVVVCSVDVYLMFPSLSFSTQPSVKIYEVLYFHLYELITYEKNTCTSLHHVIFPQPQAGLINSSLLQWPNRRISNHHLLAGRLYKWTYIPLDPNNPWKNEGCKPPRIWVFSPLKIQVLGSHDSWCLQPIWKKYARQVGSFPPRIGGWTWKKRSHHRHLAKSFWRNPTNGFSSTNDQWMIPHEYLQLEGVPNNHQGPGMYKTMQVIG